MFDVGRSMFDVRLVAANGRSEWIPAPLCNLAAPGLVPYSTQTI